MEFWESKSPFLKTPRFRGGMMAISRPEGSGHGEPHALPSLYRRASACVHSSLMSSGPTWSKLQGRLSSVCFCLAARSFSSSMGLIVDLYPRHPEIPLKAGRFFLCEAPLMWEVGRWVCMSFRPGKDAHFNCGIAYPSRCSQAHQGTRKSSVWPRMRACLHQVTHIPCAWPVSVPCK